MSRELIRRVDRLEDHPSFGLRKRPFVMWRATGEDEEAVIARAKSSGYTDGDRLVIISWQGPRQPFPH